MLTYHHVANIGDVAILSFSGEPWAVFVPTAEGIRIVWADDPTVGRLEVLHAVRQLGGRASSPEICTYLGMRSRKASNYLRGLVATGELMKREKVKCKKRGVYHVYEVA